MVTAVKTSNLTQCENPKLQEHLIDYSTNKFIFCHVFPELSSSVGITFRNNVAVGNARAAKLGVRSTDVTVNINQSPR
jgi:hypothetical protein